MASKHFGNCISNAVKCQRGKIPFEVGPCETVQNFVLNQEGADTPRPDEFAYHGEKNRNYTRVQWHGATQRLSTKAAPNRMAQLRLTAYHFSARTSHKRLPAAHLHCTVPSTTCALDSDPMLKRAFFGRDFLQKSSAKFRKRALRKSQAPHEKAENSPSD